MSRIIRDLSFKTLLYYRSPIPTGTLVPQSFDKKSGIM